MMSWNGAICRITGSLCGEFTGPVEFTGPRTKASDMSFDVFFDLGLNKRLNKQPWGGDLRRHHGHHDVNVVLTETSWFPSSSEVILKDVKKIDNILRCNVHQFVVNVVKCLHNTIFTTYGCHREWYATKSLPVWLLQMSLCLQALSMVNNQNGFVNSVLGTVTSCTLLGP